MSLEFPSSKGYVPVVQELLRDTLKVANYTDGFVDKIVGESSAWFANMIEESEFNSTHSLSLSLTCRASNLSVSIKTSEGKELKTSFEADTTVASSSQGEQLPGRAVIQGGAE